MIINIIGNIKIIKERLLEIAYSFEIDEIVVIDLCNNSEKKTELIQALAQEFQLRNST